MPALHIRLLGGFSLIYGDAPVEGLGAARLQALLAYLVVHRDAPQNRQHLAFLFWPDSTEPQARNNLRQMLHQLRHALPDVEHFLYADASVVRWLPDAPFSLDVAEFERTLDLADAAARGGDQALAREALVRAADLYRADLLPGCYDECIASERERLRQRSRHALARLLDLLEEQRDYVAAIGYARRLVGDDLLDEDANCRLISLLAQSGDRAGALRAYHACATTLRRELGVEPSEATHEIYERLLRTKARPAPAGESQRIVAEATTLIGRRREWALLLDVWRQTAEGPRFVLITGEAGIGKSRLAEELLTWAGQRGATVARTRSYAAEGRLSLAPVTEWLRSDGLRPYLARLDSVWLTEVARILPELLAEHPDLPRYEPMTEYGQRQRFFEALARAMLAESRPLLLLIDDLQWCDQETLEWLHFLLRFDSHAHLLVVGTVRGEETPAQHPLRAVLLHLRNTAAATEIALQPLDAAETARLAAQIASRELDLETAMRLYRETEGNPLFVVETMRASQAALGWGAGADEPDQSAQQPPSPDLRLLPPRVYAVIAGRLAQLSAPARELAALAAAIGRAFTLDVLLGASNVDEDAAVRALDELWQKRIVREQGANSYDFTHDKLREVAYAEISAPQRRLLHRRIARALEALHLDDLDPVSGQIAAHYERAAMAAQAIPCYQRAASVAQRVYANEDAIVLLSHGLALLDHLPAGRQRDAQELGLQLALAPIYRVTKGWTAPEVERVLGRAQELCEKVGDDAQRAQLFYGLQALYVVQARLEHVQLVSDELQKLYRHTQRVAPPLFAEMMLSGASTPGGGSSRQTASSSR